MRRELEIRIESLETLVKQNHQVLQEELPNLLTDGGQDEGVQVGESGAGGAL